MKTGCGEGIRRESAITIRPATRADCENILTCLRCAFEPFQSQYTPGAYADTVLSNDTLHQRLLEMSILVAIATSGELVGTIACKALQDGEGHLRGMAVLPSWQGSGVSSRLLNHAESELRERGCSRITLDTTEPLQRAIRFYQQNGFSATGRVIDFYGMPLFEYEKKI